MATRKPAAKKAASKPAAAARTVSAKPAVKKTAAKKAVKKAAVAVKKVMPAKPKAIESMGPRSLRKPPAPGVAEMKFSIESAFERRTMLTVDEIEGSTRPLVNRVIDGLESGEFRVAEPDGHGGWKVNEWLKKAVLLYFRVNEMEVIDGSPAPFWDKVESRFEGYGEAEFRQAGVRVVPGAIARRGTHFGKDVVLMPSFTNIGAHVGEGTMSIPGPRWGRARRSASTATCPAVPASAACWSRCRPARPSSRTTASSVPVRKWSKAWWLATTA